MWSVRSLQGEGETEGSQTVRLAYVDGGCTDELAAQIAQGQDTKLEVLKLPAAYCRV